MELMGSLRGKMKGGSVLVSFIFRYCIFRSIDDFLISCESADLV